MLDDYDWDWGDGPRRVADDYLKTEAARIRLSFVSSGAMFIQLLQKAAPGKAALGKSQ